MKTELALRHLLLRRLARHRLTAQSALNVALDRKLEELASHLTIIPAAGGGYEIEWRLQGASGRHAVDPKRFTFYDKSAKLVPAMAASSDELTEQLPDAPAPEPAIDRDAVAARNREEADAILRNIAGELPVESQSTRSLRDAWIAESAPWALAGFLALAAMSLIARCLEVHEIVLSLMALMVQFTLILRSHLGRPAAFLATALTLVGFNAVHAIALPSLFASTSVLIVLWFLQRGEERRFTGTAGFMAGLALIGPALFLPNTALLLALGIMVFLGLGGWLFPYRFSERSRRLVLAGIAASALICIAGRGGFPAPTTGAGSAEWPWLVWCGWGALLSLLSWTTGTHRHAVTYFTPFLVTVALAGCWIDGVSARDPVVISPMIAILSIFTLRWCGVPLARRAAARPLALSLPAYPAVRAAGSERKEAQRG